MEILPLILIEDRKGDTYLLKVEMNHLFYIMEIFIL